MGFTIGSALSFGWETFKKRPWFFIFVTILILVVSVLGEGVSRAVDETAKDLPFLGTLLSLAFSTLISMGVTGFALAAHDNPETVELSALWHPHSFWKYCGLSILYVLIILTSLSLVLALVATLGAEAGLKVGIPLLIVAGTIIFLMFIFSGFLVIDRGFGPIQALKESHRITRGYKWRLFGLYLLLFIINLVGIFAFVLGFLLWTAVSLLGVALLLVSAPVSLLALTHAYRILGGGAVTPRPADAALAA
jgi:hypothetical protein